MAGHPIYHIMTQSIPSVPISPDICQKISSARGWGICQFFWKRLKSFVFQYFTRKYTYLDSFIKNISNTYALKPGVPHLHVNRPSISGIERFDCIVYGHFLALDFEVRFNSEAKFYHIKHVIAEVKYPVGRNRLDIEAKLARYIDNHTPKQHFALV